MSDTTFRTKQDIPSFHPLLCTQFNPNMTHFKHGVSNLNPTVKDRKYFKILTGKQRIRCSTIHYLIGWQAVNICVKSKYKKTNFKRDSNTSLLIKDKLKIAREA